MASIEFITKRIEGKQKEITKLENKLSRIEKAKASNWEVNPYYYDESDLKWALKDLEAAKNSLSDWEAQLTAEQEKANSRNVPAILKFLEGWKARVESWYVENFPKYLEAREERYAENRAYCDWVNSHFGKEYREERDARRAAEKAADKKYNKAWQDFFRYNDHNTLNLELLKKDLEQDAAAKYDDIVERTNAICGTITDATGLMVGLKGDLDGIVIGERGTAKVQTIGAGGYNIQCFHFRTLIHEVK